MSEFECTPVVVCREKRNGEEWQSVSVRKAKDGSKVKLSYREISDVGKGTFGTVRKIVTQDGQTYALKRLEHDPRFKNREVAIMRELDHLNCCRLFYYYSERMETGKPELSINLVMEFVSDTLSAIVSRTRKQGEDLGQFIIQLYLYQLLRGTAYMHSKKIAHRDIKPQNILIESSTALLKICDFGSAKRLTEGEPNVAYICSRFYRAPELILGNTHYDVSVDTWAIGCVFAEMFLLKPIFVGDSSIDQLTEIIRVLGTPTPEQMDKLHPKFPKTLKKRDPVPLTKALKNKPSTKAIRLLTKMLQYMPDTRIRCWEALAEPFFDDLRRPNARLPDNRPLPPLFDFTSRELEQNPVLNQLLIPNDAMDSPQPELFQVYTKSDWFKFGPVWIPQVPIPSQFIPGLSPGDSPRAADRSPLLPPAEVKSKQGSLKITPASFLSKDISEQVTSNTSYEPRLVVDASEPNTTKSCPGLPPSVSPSELNTTQIVLESRLLTDTMDLSALEVRPRFIPALDLLDPNTGRTNGSHCLFKISSDQMASESITNDNPEEISDKLTSIKVSSPETNSSKPSANTSQCTHNSNEQSSCGSTDDTPKCDQRGAGVTCSKEDNRWNSKRFATRITDFCFVTIRGEHPHELIRVHRKASLSSSSIRKDSMEGVNDSDDLEDEYKMIADLSNLAEQVGMSPESAVALKNLMVKHRLYTLKPTEESNFDIDLINPQTEEAIEKIKADAHEVMSEEDLDKLDDIFAVIQQKRNEYRAAQGGQIDSS